MESLEKLAKTWYELTDTIKTLSRQRRDVEHIIISQMGEQVKTIKYTDEEGHERVFVIKHPAAILEMKE